MQDQGIGTYLACFYEAWAWLLEQVGNTKRADAVYKEGRKNLAQPLDALERKHEWVQVTFYDIKTNICFIRKVSFILSYVLENIHLKKSTRKEKGLNTVISINSIN